MQEPSVFIRVIRGELPSHKIYEDDKTYAFLDIHPSQPGLTLVVPKTQVARLQDMEDADYIPLMQTVRKVMRRQSEVFGPDYKICLKVMGFDVPHVHVLVIPCKTPEDFEILGDQSSEPDHTALAQMAKKLAF
jgi:histidine triad (HIT) family protein